MNAILPVADVAVRPMHMADVPDGLRMINRPGVDLAIWKRPVSATPDLPAGWARLEAVQYEAPLKAVDAALIDRLGAAGRALARDVAALARVFAEVAGVSRVAVRLEALEGDACRRWHVDYKRLRLLCTYAGPGTVWCERDAAGAVIAVGRQRRLSVGIYKGLLYPGGPSGRLLHRSPRIAAAGRRRLILCIDEAD